MSVAVARKRRRLERLRCADVADGLVVGVLDHAPERAHRTHLSVLGVPDLRAFGRLARKGTDIFAVRPERDGSRRWSVEAEFPASFAEVHLRYALSLALRIPFGPENTEIC